MNQIENIEVGLYAPLRKAAEVLEAYRPRFVLVVDENRQLQGTITDGDIRRGLLRGASPDSPAAEIMNAHPHVAHEDETHAQIAERMQCLQLRHMPVVDAEGRPLRLEMLPLFHRPARHPNPVVIMAGGEGRRLRPLTETVPKPMLPVGGRPILETIVHRLALQGFTDVYLSVNYRGDMIKDHFGDGSEHGVRIRYLEEERPLGTAGSLHLLPERPHYPFLVLNADVLTTLNYGELVGFHLETAAAMTVCVQPYQVAVPFGVVEVDGEYVRALREKPVYDYFVSSGIYVLRPDVLDRLEPGVRLDMPDLMNQLMAEDDRHVSAFPLREYWVDVGRVEDLSRARNEFTEVFGEETV